MLYNIQVVPAYIKESEYFKFSIGIEWYNSARENQFAGPPTFNVTYINYWPVCNL